MKNVVINPVKDGYGRLTPPASEMICLDDSDAIIIDEPLYFIPLNDLPDYSINTNLLSAGNAK